MYLIRIKYVLSANNTEKPRILDVSRAIFVQAEGESRVGWAKSAGNTAAIRGGDKMQAREKQNKKEKLNLTEEEEKEE